MVSKYADQVAAAAQGVKDATTETTVEDILRQRDAVAAKMVRLSTSGNFGDQVIGMDDYGQPIMGQSGDYKQLAALADTFDALGTLAKSKTGTDGGDGGISASALAQLGMQERQLAESMRQFDVGEARQNREFAETMGFNREELSARTDYQNRSLAEQSRIEAERMKEEQRRNNLSSTLDMLSNQIKIGDIGVAEATNRISAATNAANVQRDILADHAGKAVAPGAKYYPNLGPGGPIATMAQALGQPFAPFETTGTFAIDPNAIAAPISSAPGNSQLPGLNDAAQRAAAALAGMGVPQMAEGGAVQGPYVSGEAGPELNIPTGDGTNLVMNLRDMIASRFGQGGASIPRGEMPTPQMPQFGNFDPQQWYSQIPPVIRQRLQSLLAGMQNNQGGVYNGMNWIRPPVAPVPAQPDPMQQQMSQFAQRVQSRGVVPPTPDGRSQRPPQMGLQAAARALAGM